jgi:nitrite reductase (NADH) large subunit
MRDQISPDRSRLLVIGNGMAGMRTVEEVLKRDPQRYRVTVIGAEPHVNYNRILLSPVLAGEKSFDEIVINSRDWYDAKSIELIAGDAAIAIDTAQKQVTTASGRVVSYDKLLLATGSNPFILPVPGKELPGVCAFRDMSDVDTMLSAAQRYRNAVVIGGGLLGLEAANGLAAQGMKVSVIHLMETLMERQLDPAAATLLADDLTRRGIDIITGAVTEALIGADRVQAVRLKDGRQIPADLVVMAAGIRPNMSLAQAAGLTCNRGIIVDDGLCTSDPSIYAVGECTEHNGQMVGLVAPIWDQAKVCADHLTGKTASAYSPIQPPTRLKVTGIDMLSVGQFNGGEGCEDIILRDGSRGVYKRLVLKDDILVGAVLYGDAKDGGWYVDLMGKGAPLGALRDTVIFGPGLTASGATDSGLADLPDETEICGCNGVCKGTIMAAIADKGLTTLKEVKVTTKAAASCGSCSSKVEGLLALALGGEYEAKTVESVCGCTDHSHEFVRAAIRDQHLKSIPQVMKTLGWRTPGGCASCRPALNFYLLCAWPGEYQDDSRSRFINERAHANIQKDGTFSVIPRMWGGVTTSGELRAIADVVDKYEIPSVKVTGGQRIDLLGVKKEDLVGVWADLNAAGMVSGHAYGKALRTVKTCVGSEWCRFGTQDSTGMGIKLERMTWGSWHPHKVKLAVSGCPRNCAEATIKDFGVIAVDSGWELLIGGNGGIALRGCDFLVKVATEEEVLEYCAAFLQLYREEARYLERTAPWVERVGLAYVKSRLLDDKEARRALAARFAYAQSFAQIDPWAERVGGMDANEFKPMLVEA